MSSWHRYIRHQWSLWTTRLILRLLNFIAMHKFVLSLTTCKEPKTGLWCTDYCLPEAEDIVTLPMKSVSFVVAHLSFLCPKLFQAPGGSSRSPLDRLSLDWHRSKPCIYYLNWLSVKTFPMESMPPTPPTQHDTICNFNEYIIFSLLGKEVAINVFHHFPCFKGVIFLYNSCYIWRNLIM